ncbi:hypothetical protein Back2_00650 [Nocardioides baekrokdamisoli]|uniref:Uncharacterized protein n=1 Tax=Nocardioides baekrokdamisoli TaxID=1804624 RepID=A0A3G9IWZ0_9ACTN|nr:hypothetical protein [Nocardioides baekrokdamisoli]BBH15778.1 hypothetical protein Back2_00650 [Nocardioides baekrokdamisoli]
MKKPDTKTVGAEEVQTSSGAGSAGAGHRVTASPVRIGTADSVQAKWVARYAPSRVCRVDILVSIPDRDLTVHALQSRGWQALDRVDEADDQFALITAVASRFGQQPTSLHNAIAAEVQTILAMYRVNPHSVSVYARAPDLARLHLWAVAHEDASQLAGPVGPDGIYTTSDRPKDARSALGDRRATGRNEPIDPVARESKSTRTLQSWTLLAIALTVFAAAIADGYLAHRVFHGWIWRWLPPSALLLVTLAAAAVEYVLKWTLVTGRDDQRPATGSSPRKFFPHVAAALRINSFADGAVPRLKRWGLAAALLVGACVGWAAGFMWPPQSLTATIATAGVGLAISVVALFWVPLRRMWTPPRLASGLIGATTILAGVGVLARVMATLFFAEMGVPVDGIDLNVTTIGALTAVPLMIASGGVAVLLGVWFVTYRGRYAPPMSWLMGAITSLACIAVVLASMADLASRSSTIWTGTGDHVDGYAVTGVCLYPTSPTLTRPNAWDHPLWKLGDRGGDLVVLDPVAARARQRGRGGTNPSSIVSYLPANTVRYLIVDPNSPRCP